MQHFASRLTQVIHSFGIGGLAGDGGRGIGQRDLQVASGAGATERGEPGGAGARGAGVGRMAGDRERSRRRAQAASRHAVEHGDYIFMPRNRIRFSSGREGILRSEQVVDSIAFRAEWVKRTLRTETRDLILIEVVGDSMAPTVEDGDLILANLAEPRFRQDGIYLLRHDSGLTVKRIQRRPDGKLLVRSDNPKYESMVVASVSIIGRVIWIGGCV